MKLRAQNTIEIITMVALVAVVVVSAFMFMNGNNANLANLSSINDGKKSIAVSKAPSINREHSVINTTTQTSADIETAGALSLLAQISKNDLKEKVANKTLNDFLVIKTEDNEDIIDISNKVIESFPLPKSPIDRNSDINTIKAEIIDVAIAARDKINANNNQTVNELAKSLYEQLAVLLYKTIY